MFKKIKYHTGESLVKIKIEDDTGALMENWAIMFSDLWDWFQLMRRKYGDNTIGKVKRDRDLDWAI